MFMFILNFELKLLSLSPAGYLINGFLTSDCHLPCVRTQVHIEEGTVSVLQGATIFSLMFNDKVRIKKTSVDKFSFLDSLNFFGSNLGLWPGLGLYQILEWVVGILIIKKWIYYCRLI